MPNTRPTVRSAARTCAAARPGLDRPTLVILVSAAVLMLIPALQAT